MTEPIMVVLTLPWYDHEEQPQKSAMTLVGPPEDITRKVAFKMMRAWYKEHIGVTPPFTVMGRIWSSRFTTRAMTEAVINAHLQELSVETYNQSPDTKDQSEASGGTE